MEDNLTIWNTSKKISSRYTRISSVNLESVFDKFSCMQFSSWQSNNNKQFDIPLQNIVSRVGAFPASLARYFIAAYTNELDIVLDPFCGKGTALLEAARLGRKAIGGDIAPDAVLISRAKCNPPSIAEIVNYIQEIPLTKKPDLSFIPNNVSLFYSKKTLLQIISIRENLLKDLNSKSHIKNAMATFTISLLLGILHGKSKLSLSLPSNQCFAMSPNYVRSYVKEHNLKRPNRDVKKCLIEKALNVLPAPVNMAKSSIFELPAEKCNEYLNNLNLKAKLVITSPPYLDRQTYLKDSWLRLWFLGYDWKALKKKSLETGSLKIFLDGIEKTLIAIWDSLENKGKAVIVCGQAISLIQGEKKETDICALFLLMLNRLNQKKVNFTIDSIISDKVELKRGSYFAVTHRKGMKSNNTNRYKKDEILVLTKSF